MLHSHYFQEPVTEVDLVSPVELYQWHKVCFDVSGNTLKTWIDDQLVDEWTELPPVYRCGKVGFRLWGRECTLYQNPRVMLTKKWVPREE